MHSREQASHYVHECLLREVNDLNAGHPTLLDLGCGIGASLSYLLDRLSTATGIGLSISAVQVQLADQAAHARASFRRGDFCRDTLPGPIDLAYAVEAFVHAHDPAAFFTRVSSALRPGGRLVIVDDFLSVTDRSATGIARFKAGWHAASLMSADEADALGASAGLHLSTDRDLTPYLKLTRPRDRALAALMLVARRFAASSPWLQSLDGGDALRYCLANGLVTYRWRVWTKLSGA